MKGGKPIAKPVKGAMKSVPTMPAHVPREMRKEWGNVCRDLIDRKLLTEVTIGHVAAYLFCEWQIQIYAKEIKRVPLVKDGNGRMRPAPATGLLNKAFELKARYGAELGLSPAARARRGLSEAMSEESGEDISALGF